MKNLLTAVLLGAVLTLPVYAQTTPAKKQEPAKKAAMPKVEVKKPCKPGQTAADGCHEVKKVEKKAPPKKQEKKK